MIRIAIVAIVFLGAGVAIGWVAAPAAGTPSSESSGPAATRPAVLPSADLERLNAERDRLEQENDDLTAQLAQLLEEQGQWVAPPAPESGGAVEHAELPESDGDDRRDRGRPVSLSEADMRAFREGMERESAQRMQEFEDRMEEQITDPVGIERYNTLMDLRDYQRALSDKMREAESDERREALRKQRNDARDSARQIVTEQQDDMLRAIAASNGINDPAKQSEFIAAMRETVSSPFFELEDRFVDGSRQPWPRPR